MTTEISPRTKTSAEKAAMFRRLGDYYRELQQDTNNKNDHARWLIAACLEEEIKTGSQIIGVLGRLGLDKAHVGAVLTKNKGQFWRRQLDGTYVALPPLN